MNKSSAGVKSKSSLAEPQSSNNKLNNLIITTMKKTQIILSSFAVMLAVVGFIGQQSPKSIKTMDLTLANLEALTTGTESGVGSGSESGSGCDNNNGYRTWYTTGGFWDKPSQFYDCCGVLREGFSPSGVCN